MTQGRIVIDSERCKGCELCTGVCPQRVIRMSGTFNSGGYRPAQLADPGGACTGCGVCAIICPDVAITVYRQLAKEPRATNRAPHAPRPGPQPGSLGVVAGSGREKLP